ncbi:hypothetical protein OD350_29170 (plasmid) [Clostridium beijerinckii]|uniref:hypothetical protein n=1 Tax=Clostridium beijerinckii TaxID=1520 RepID=UPI00222616F2|nr:hypothetical protein [Clostridium beijerinckii]UYZ38961.1 hypothetical protein OD350_29170 [Clostridium beijerinckii]
MIIENKYFLFALANCGIMTNNIARKFYKMHHKTLNQMLQNDILINKGNLLLYGKVSTIYVLSEKTKNLIRKYGKAPYKTNTSQLEHDYLLLKSYSSLPIKVQLTWINETELKELYSNTATTDGVFILDNKKIGIEVLTSNYTNEMIEKKFKFAAKECDKLITMNTSDIRI